ncbi:hypothetical protein HF888_13320 [Bermanella marisrubri]|uniref:Uncharacterized protein n=1 Tax=Bermanella marisrubri TaxID=207949 RepID=Q1N350_9GAMM|nr:hypothetical protein [Bermanella marisrubri]EAT12741.1 hypothetical protein RED65_13692 [Oceanobacter sp. RED65] [Bermanella marisrubri]QIZ85142.1 hypothetical protein HF888_13320 [Bermanella marisrubri]
MAELDSPSKNGKKNNKGPGLVDIETWFNLFLQKLFPVWYCVRYVAEMPMEYLGDINPKSFLCHRWLSISDVNHAAANSLEHAGDSWKDCAGLLRKIHRTKSYKRYLSIRNVTAVQSSVVDENYESLYEYGEAECKDIPNHHAEHFDALSFELFGDKTKHYPFVYREVDGRYYYRNTEEPRKFAALLMHCRNKQRDLMVKADIEVQSVDMRVVEIMRSRYWLLLMKRDSAYQIAYLVRAAKIHCQIAEFEWRRSDLVFLVLRKDDYRTAQIVESMVRRHFPRSVMDWGRYLCTHNIPFRNR